MAALAVPEPAVASHAVSTAAARDAREIATLTGVSKRFGKVVALDGLDLAIRSGEIFGLLGPNGAGKTTAVRLLLGLTAPDKGEARIFGKDPQHAAARVRAGAMLQVARVPETLRVREHINLFRSYYPAPLPLDEVMEIAGVTSIQNRMFADLSGGQKQRTLFAMAICGNPDLVFLDEPTVGLDIEARRALWEAIRNLADIGKSVLLTTHYLEEADHLSHRIAVLNSGRVITQGTPAEIKSLVQGRSIRCSTALTDAELRLLPGVQSVSRERETVLLSSSNAEASVRELLLRDATVFGLEVKSAALEDAFLSLTQSKS